MFQSIELGRKLSKADFEAELPGLRASILAGQRALRDSQQSVLVIIEGVDGAGQDELLNRLYCWLDPRGVLTHTFWNPEEKSNPHSALCRLWKTIPAKGKLCIHLGGWYRDLIKDAVTGKISEIELGLALKKRHDFEQMLALEGVIILKFGLYIPESVQRKRLSSNPVSADDHWDDAGKKIILEKRDDFLKIADQVMHLTDNRSYAPWHVIEATCPRYRDITVGKTIAGAMLHATQWHEAWKRESRESFSQFESSELHALPDAESARVTILDQVNLNQKLEKTTYRKKLEKLQKELSELSWQAWKEKITTVVVFEGWDAAGKGGAIRRLTEGLDARLYHAVQYGAPTEEERNYPYLWRFWRELPANGQIVIYDRSWYGRVLVERVEKFSDVAEWSRAYNEINEFEAELIADGTVTIKFWLHISQDEQLRRFRERELIPYKQHKITEEDWRNREKWAEYSDAVSDMITRTGTAFAPWTLVSSENKYVGRIQVLQTVIDRLKRALADRKKT